MNYANADMVGHTGKWEAIITALDVVDDCLGKVEKAALDAGAVLLVTADHGNAEEKIDLKTGRPKGRRSRQKRGAVVRDRDPLEGLGIGHGTRLEADPGEAYRGLP